MMSHRSMVRRRVGSERELDSRPRFSIMRGETQLDAVVLKRKKLRVASVPPPVRRRFDFLSRVATHDSARTPVKSAPKDRRALGGAPGRIEPPVAGRQRVVAPPEEAASASFAGSKRCSPLVS